ncbi:hypothetical protein J4E93_004034 [Alternaria ventricosa]|uniref:uncharacterized protein n=1 Tax=Alternaria ventricosa TaxID=1187951 RepID=UPI0020C1F2A1|nr:uncharacterized protein J4E93_004034 [Alternaria ventricosa]KAI4649713.1 hypothetical protein J4E93_004034 [Alternaria ventricosa]
MNMAMNSMIKEEGDVYKQDKNEESDVYTREYRKIPTIIAKAVKTAELTNTSLTPYQTTSAVLRQPKESLSSSFFSIDDCTKETRSPKQSGKNSTPKLRRIGYQKMNGR